MGLLFVVIFFPHHEVAILIFFVLGFFWSLALDKSVQVEWIFVWVVFIQIHAHIWYLFPQLVPSCLGAGAISCPRILAQEPYLLPIDCSMIESCVLIVSRYVVHTRMYCLPGCLSCALACCHGTPSPFSELLSFCKYAVSDFLVAFVPCTWYICVCACARACGRCLGRRMWCTGEDLVSMGIQLKNPLQIP